MNQVYLFVLTLQAASNIARGSVQFTEEPSDRIVVLGTTVRWNCSAISTTPGAVVRYRWRHQDVGLISDYRRYVTEDGVLAITSVLASDLGMYQCLAQDGVSQAFSRRSLLQQAYLAPNFRLSPYNQIARLSETVIMSCDINSVPPAVLSWQHNGQPISAQRTHHVAMVTPERSQLMIKKVTYRDAGSYRCRATNRVIGDVTYSGEARLELEGKPRLVIEPQPTITQIGHIAQLSCVAAGYPPPTLAWYDSRQPGNDVAIQESSKYSLANESLTIHDVTSSDAGFYTCRAGNAWGQRSKTVLLTVTDAATLPIFTRVPEDTTVFAGETVTWTCSASGSPPPIISWARVGAPIAEQRVREPYPGTLQLLDVGQADAGAYICRAAGANIHDIIHHNWTLKVQEVRTKLESQVTVPIIIQELVLGLEINSSTTLGPAERPLIELSPDDKAVIEGRPVVMNCRASGRPIPTLTWTLPDAVEVPVPGSSKLHEVVTYGNGSLVIPVVQTRHAGRYSCTARNVVGAQSASAVLYVYYGPQFTVTPSKTTVLEGNTASIHCSGDGYPQPTVTWYGPSSNQTLGNGRGIRILNNGTLVLENVYRWQEGRYTCVIENSVNQMIVSAELEIMVSPTFTSSPLDVVVKEGATISMPCSAQGKPEPNTRWQLFNEESIVLEENMVLHPNGTLTIFGMATHQYGAYVCIALSDAGMSAQTSYLRPDDIPVFTTTPQNLTTNLSSSAHFKCSATARATPILRWHRARMSLTGQTMMGPALNSDVMDGRGYMTHDADLVFEEVLETDEGWYMCVAENSYGNATARAFLDVKAPPHVMPPQNVIITDEGSSVTLQCPLSSDPPAMLSWQLPHSDTIISESSGDYVIEGDELSIVTAEVSRDAGMWTCRACNYLGCTDGKVTLQVNGGAVIVGANASHSPSTNTTRMRCIAAGTPTPHVSYEWAGLDVEGGASDGAELKLTGDGWLEVVGAIHPPYGCTATNRLGTDTGLLTVPSYPSDIRVSDITNTSLTMSWQQDMTTLLPPTNIIFLLTTPEVPNISPTQLMVPILMPQSSSSSGGESGSLTEGGSRSLAVDALRLLDASPDKAPTGAMGIIYEPQTMTIGSKTYTTNMAYVINNLQPYTRYRIQMAAQNVLGRSEYSVASDFNMASGAPSIPTDLRAEFTDGKLVVYWNRPLVINGNLALIEYEAQYHSSAPGGSSLTSRIPSQRPLVATFSGTRQGDTVNVKVYAINTERDLWSQPAIITLVINGEAPIQPPSGVRAWAVSDTDIHVQWQAPSSESSIVGYVVAVGRQASSDFTVFRIKNAQARKYQIVGVDPGETYYVKAAAYNYGGVGPYSTLVNVNMPQTGGALRPNTESNSTGLSQETVIGIVAGCVAVVFLILLCLLACCCYHRRRQRLLEKDIDAIYQQNQIAFYDNEDYLSDTLDSRKSAMRDLYEARKANDDSRNSTLSRITTNTTESQLPGPPDVLPTYRLPAEGNSLPDVHQQLGAADYELAEVTYAHSPATSHYSTGTSTTGTYAELDLPPSAHVNPMLYHYPTQGEPQNVPNNHQVVAHSTHYGGARTPSGHRRQQQRMPSSDVIVLSVADVWSLPSSSHANKAALPYNTQERTTHFTNQTFRPQVAPTLSATLGRKPKHNKDRNQGDYTSLTLGRYPTSATMGRDPRDPRNPAPLQKTQEFETLTRRMNFESESSDSSMHNEGRGMGGAAVGSKSNKSLVGRKNSASSVKLESGFSPDITFWQTPTTDQSAGLF